MNSEDVERMTDAEVGQYMLLLCKSFVSGKAASLPDDPKYLAKWARCKRVSDLVLSKFPLVETEWGRRRRNETIYGEWLSAADRSASASERGKKGNEIRWGQGGNGDRSGGSPSDRYSDTPAIATSHTIPINHTNQNIHEESSGQGSFKTIRAHWYRYFKKDLSTSKRNKEQYAQSCATYGEDRLLEYLKQWAVANEWVASHAKGENRLYVFLADLPVLIAGDQMRTESKTAEGELSKNEFKALESAEMEKIQRETAEFLRKEKEEEAFVEATRGMI